MFSHVADEFGRLDVLVNNAGVTRDIDFFELPADEWDAIMQVNARGSFLCMRQAARYMRDSGGGLIINISSIADKGWPGASNIAYAASKGAVVTMTRIAAAQLAPFNITVNAVCPGVTRTPLVAQLLRSRAITLGTSEEKVTAALHATIPLGRANDPSDVADAIEFLASDQARNITGQSLNVDGGNIWD